MGGIPPSGVVSSFTAFACPSSDMSGIAGVVTSQATWPAANRAIYISFLVEEAFTAYQMIFEVAVASGNYDAGIYDSVGTRLVSTGSTAVPAAGVGQANIADTLLNPGLYYMALCVDNTTASFSRANTNTLQWHLTLGIRNQAVGAVTLPATATFANPISTYLPLLGVALQATL